MRTAILAITKNGLVMGRKLKANHPDWIMYAPIKLRNGTDISWFEEATSAKIGNLFRSYEALICLFSLGAVIRLLAPHIQSKKTDPAVIVIDDGANHVISALSGHLGGANELAASIADELGATPVITTAADVNKTIAVDMVGKRFGWTIEDDRNVTAVSAHMVNGEKIGLYQDAGEPDWWDGDLPKNVQKFDTLDKMRSSDSMACLIISDRIHPDMDTVSVIYRPRSLAVGIGIHMDTPKQKILDSIESAFREYGLSTKSIAKLASIKKDEPVPGLVEAASHMGVPLERIERDELARVQIPNPSRIVEAYEGTASVSEASAILSSGGRPESKSLIVQKQKFPPDLTIAVARCAY